MANFSIDLRDVLDVLGFSRIDLAKRLLTKKHLDLVKDIDYISIKTDTAVKGNKKEDIYITEETFYIMLMEAQTENSKHVRKFLANILAGYNSISNIQEDVTNLKIDVNRDMHLVYLIELNHNNYKFGITQNLDARLSTHLFELAYIRIIKTWDCLKRRLAYDMEKEIKKYVKKHKIDVIYKKKTECFKSGDDDIAHIVEDFDAIHDLILKNYENLCD